MTADEFRANKDLVIGLRNALMDQYLVLAMEILADDQNPVKVLPQPNITPTFANIQLGQQTGWAQYPDMLRLLARHPDAPPTTADEPTYPDPLAPPPAEEE